MNKLRRVFNRDGSIRKMVYPDGTRRYWWDGTERDVAFYWHVINEKNTRRRLQKSYAKNRVHIGVDPSGGSEYINWSNISVVRRPAAPVQIGRVRFSVDAEMILGATDSLDMLGRIVGVAENEFGEPLYRIVDARGEGIGTIVELRADLEIGHGFSRYAVIETFADR
jgi:hypothetical protein